MSDCDCSLCRKEKHLAKPKNARFWVWHRKSWVKIVLKPGQRMCIGYRIRTDEGYVDIGGIYTYEDGVVEWESTIHSVDCDGPMSEYADYVCHVDELSFIPAYDICHSGEESTPNWVEKRHSVRDIYAERMGY